MAESMVHWRSQYWTNLPSLDVFTLCWGFIAWQYQRSYQHANRLVKVCNQGAAPLRDQASDTMTQYPTQSHYPDTEQTSHCLFLLMLSDRLVSDKNQFDKSLAWLGCDSNSWPCWWQRSRYIGDFVTLLHRETRPPTPWDDMPLNHIILKLS